MAIIGGSLNTFADVAQIIGLFVALVGLAAVFVQIRSANEQLAGARNDALNAQTRAFEQRYTSSEFVGQSSLVIAFLIAVDAADCVNRIRAYENRRHAAEPCLPRARSHPNGPNPSVLDVQWAFSFFEQFATAYNLGQLDRATVHRGFCVEPLQLLTDGWWYVSWVRDGELATGDAVVFGQLQEMVLAIVEAVPELALSFQVAPPIRVLCLPQATARDGAVPRDAWTRAQRISRLLDEKGGDLAGVLAELHARVAASGHTRPSSWRWRVLVIAPRVSTRPSTAWSNRTRRAEQIAGLLDRLAEDDVVRIVEASVDATRSDRSSGAEAVGVQPERVRRASRHFVMGEPYRELALREDRPLASARTPAWHPARHRLTIVRHGGRIVAVCGPRRTWLTPRILALPRGHAVTRMVSLMCLYARDVRAGVITQVYSDEQAARFARWTLIDSLLFAEHERCDDVQLARLLRLPVEEIPAAREDFAARL